MLRALTGPQSATAQGLRRTTDTLSPIFGIQQRRWRSSRKTGARLKPTNDDEYREMRATAVETPHPEAISSEGSSNIIDRVIGVVPAREVAEEYKNETEHFDISPFKLNDLARLIRRKPIENAILQMQYSSKKAAVNVKALLVESRNEAMFRGMDRDRLIVDRAWVTKGPVWKQVDIRARGKSGMITHPSAKISVVLKHGKSKEMLEQEKNEKFISKALRSGADQVSYNRPITNMGLGRGLYGW